VTTQKNWTGLNNMVPVRFTDYKRILIFNTKQYAVFWDNYNCNGCTGFQLQQV